MMGRILSFLKRPNAAFIIVVWIMTVIVVAADIAVLAASYKEWPSYVVYALSAILLGYSAYTLAACRHTVRQRAAAVIARHPFLNNIFVSYGFRTVTFFVLSLAVNVAFVLFNAVLGVVTCSLWYGIIATYYVFLGALRAFILFLSYRARRRSEGNERLTAELKLRIYRLCGILILALEIALAAAVSLMVMYGKPTQYSEVMAIAAAAYTFYKVIFAVYNVFKVRRYNDRVLQCLRDINLTDAAVSLLSLQVTLIAVFSDEQVSASEITAMNSVTGFAVCALTIALGIAMIIVGCRQLGRLKNGYESGRE